MMEHKWRWAWNALIGICFLFQWNCAGTIWTAFVFLGIMGWVQGQQKHWKVALNGMKLKSLDWNIGRSVATAETGKNEKWKTGDERWKLFPPAPNKNEKSGQWLNCSCFQITECVGWHEGQTDTHTSTYAHRHTLKTRIYINTSTLTSSFHNKNIQNNQI